MQFEVKEEKFYLDKKPFLLLCGELQYFRMPRESWEKALDQLVACGCNGVAYYVPWFVHEYEEGRFDFTGRVHPDNDLHTWIRLTRERGLLGFLRPGPYVYAETTDLGIPRWFTEAYPDARVRRWKDGGYQETDFANSVAHNHPDFLRAVERWYEALCREVRGYQAPEGNLVLFQLCNEIPGDDHDDENPRTLGLGSPKGMWPEYLQKTYGTLEALNARYHTAFAKWEQICPHQLREADGEAYSQEHLQYYYGTYFPRYFQTLERIVREHGIHVQLVHNAYNPRAVSLHYQNKRQNPWLLVGTDCYYSMSGRLGIRELTYYCEFGPEYTRRFLQNTPWVVEQECGYWNDFPNVYGPELYIWNIWTMACGYQGMNLYLFAGGVNRPGMGFYGTEHNWQAPVDAWGNPGDTYPYIKKSLKEIRKNQEVFLAECRYDIGLGIPHRPGLIWRPVSKAASEAYFLLKSAGFTPRIYDYEAMTQEQLLACEVLWIVSDEFMEAGVQRNLAGYVKEGGRLIVSGRVPDRTPEGEECRILADALGIRGFSAPWEESHQKKLILGGVEYFLGQAVQRIVPKAAESFDAAILAVTEEGEPAALLLGRGRGKALILPVALEMKFWGLADAVRNLLEELSAVPMIRGARRLRLIPKEGGHAVVMNLHPVSVREEIVIQTEREEHQFAQELAPHSYLIL